MKNTDHHKIDLSPELRAKYAYYRELACDLEQRDFAFKKMREIIVYESQHDFDPEKHSVDARIPKGGILDAIRDSCK